MVIQPWVDLGRSLRGRVSSVSRRSPAGIVDQVEHHSGGVAGGVLLEALPRVAGADAGCGEAFGHVELRGGVREVVHELGDCS